MRTLILTGQRFGIAGLCLPKLIGQPGVRVVSIILSESRPPSRWKRLKRDLRKVLRIGPLGALVGLRMRRWYGTGDAPDLVEVARQCGVPVESTPRVNCERTQELFHAAAADVGLSLGNGYIAPRVFTIPRLGMLNVHGEILPDFQGAASVIWPIYEGRSETGFSIHRIDERIDTGPIVYQERYPIVWRETLEQTVRASVAETSRRIPPALAKVVGNLEPLLKEARPQSGGKSYTTPTFGQYRRMLRNHAQLACRRPGA